MSDTAAEMPDAPGPRSNRLEEMLRVDHAGEYGAVNIYRGQRAVFEKLRGKERMTALLQEMEDGEQHHLEAFDRLLLERNIRPTIFSPLWNAAGFALGAGTALMGEKAAMACTSAVEDVIEKHYGEQVEELEGDTKNAELRDTLAQFREDEIGHHDTAIEEGAEDAFAYGLMKRVIGAGCKMAIRISEKA
ncbi:MAG: demethoxyubiquinone hydroxylase family protein [Pseudomonadota bacterium]